MKTPLLPWPLRLAAGVALTAIAFGIFVVEALVDATRPKDDRNGW
jgi:hypothetical protein